MTTNIVPIQNQPLMAFSQEQRDLIKRTVAPDATNDELAMFLHVAAKSGLDPLQKQIWFVKRSGRVTIQAGIDGLQARAAREPDYEGMLYGVVCKADAFSFDATTGVVKEHTYNPFADRGPTLGAWCIVRRKGLLPFTAMVRFSEYVQQGSPLWSSKPAVMIEKVARSTALRRAYPEQFGGIYEPTEMGDKGHDVTAEVVPEAQPIPSRAAEAKRLEAPPVNVTPPAPPLHEGVPPGVALVDKANAAGKGFKAMRDAAKQALGQNAGPAPAWSHEQTAAVEAILFPLAPGEAAEADAP